MSRIILLIAVALADADGGTGGPPAPPAARAVPSPPGVPPRLLAPLPVDPTQQPPPPIDKYRLVRSKDGSNDLLYDASGFSARVARDGLVTFHDKHISGIELLPFFPLLSSGGGPTGVPTLEGTIRRIGARRSDRAPPVRPDPTADETRWPSTTASRYRPDPREACQYPRPCFFDASVLLLGASAGLDITDELMRLAGQDPYRYEKARFLTATRELRIRMAGRAHAEDVNSSAASLPALLRGIACDERLSPGERRAVIQALRDELDVDSPEARAYRDQIRRFVDGLETPDAGALCPAR
jgi:hypothetical protein